MKPYIILTGTLEQVAEQTNELIDQFYEPQGLVQLDDGSWMQPMYRGKDAEERRRMLAEVQGQLGQFHDTMVETTDKTLEQSRLHFAKMQSESERRHNDFLGKNE